MRRTVGVVLVVVGVYALFGGLFAPPSVILADPTVIPLPEAMIAVAIMFLGATLALWPARRT
ncbi:hypothetical protein [Agromyces laixinhei]|uniref:hypothetical protein n=1 Tax=Agromyces laixinhei TaxID=2585717 RepID=UPI0012ECDCC5|nr:hypothetical protein [Agromyces laixinhei]